MNSKILARAAVIVLITSVLLLTIGSFDSDSAVSEESIVVDEGWECKLKANPAGNTASIVGMGTHTEYTKEAPLTSTDPSVKTFKKDVDDLPSKVHKDGVEYTVTELGDYLFQNPNGPDPSGSSKYNNYVFENINVPHSVKKIGDGCFQWNSYGGRIPPKVKPITMEVTFEEGSQLEEVGNNAFYCCGFFPFGGKGSVNVELPDTVKIIGDNAFGSKQSNNNCIKTTFDLKNAEYIGHRAFYGCKSLETLDLSKVHTLSDEAFRDCKNLKYVDLSNCTYFNPNCFSGCPNVIINAPSAGLYTVTNDSGTFQLQSYQGDTVVISLQKSVNCTSITIPKEVTILDRNDNYDVPIQFENGSKLKIISDNCFFDRHFETGMTIDLSNTTMLEQIGSHAFDPIQSNDGTPTKDRQVNIIGLKNCTNLRSIGECAFEGYCFEGLSLPTSVERIGKGAFSCSLLGEVNFTGLNNLEIISDRAFFNSTTSSLTGLENLKQLRTIGSEAFSGLSENITKVSLKGCSNLVSIGKDAFLNVDLDISSCPSLELVDVSCALAYDDKTPRIVNKGTNTPFNCPKVTANADGLSTIELTEDTILLTRDLINIKIDNIVCNSPRFHLKDGVLYDNHGSILMKVESDAVTITIPDTVREIEGSAFTDTALQTIHLKSDLDSSLFNSLKETEFIVDDSCVGFIEDMKSDIRMKQIVHTCSDIVLSVGSQIGFSSAMPVFEDVSGKVTVSVVSADGYSKYDVVLSDGSSDYSYQNWTFGSSSNLIFKEIPRTTDGNSPVVKFNANGGQFDDTTSEKDVKIPTGLSILNEDVPVPTFGHNVLTGWNLNGASYDMDSQVTGNITLTAVWTDMGYLLNIDCLEGNIIAYVNGMAISSGDRVSSGESVTLTFYPNPGYMFKNWNVNGTTMDAYPLELQQLADDTTVTVETTGYSADSLKYLITDNPAIDPQNYVNSWNFGGKVDTSMAQWGGHISTPVILGDHVYARVSDNLFKISLETGIIEGTAVSVNQTDFYHHVGCIDGMIVDYATGTFYDPDLNPLFKTEESISAAFDYGDYALCVHNGTPVLYSTSDDPQVVEIKNPVWNASKIDTWFGLNGNVSTPIIIDHYAFFISVDGKDISLISIDLKDGTIMDRKDLPSLYGHYLDDGWLTYNDGKLYLSSYSVGLFGESQADVKRSAITTVYVDGGMFTDDAAVDTVLEGSNSLTSQFVIFNGRGYVNSTEFNKSSWLYVYDVANMSLIYKQETVPTHGSIVVDASQAKTENNNAVKIYLLSYNSSELVVVNDNETKSAADSSEKYFGGTYCSQGVRFANDGTMIWYDDSGHLHAYVSRDSNKYYFMIQNGDEAVWYNAVGETVQIAANNLDDSILTLDGMKGLATVNGSAADGWNINKHDNSNNSWFAIDNFQDYANNRYHYYVISNGSMNDESKYTYLNESGEKKIYQMMSSVESELDGIKMIVGDNTSVIRFYEDNSEMTEYTLLGIADKIVPNVLPEVSKEGFKAVWKDSEGNVVTSVTQMPSKDIEVRYDLSWVYSTTYGIEGSYEKGVKDTTVTLNITKSEGILDVDDSHLYVSVKYDGGKYVSFFLPIAINSGSASTDIIASSCGLDSIAVLLVSGTPADITESYGSGEISIS